MTDRKVMKMESRKYLKKIVTVGILIIMTLAMTAASFAESGITKISKKDAEKIALKDAGLKRTEVKRLESEYDDGKYEVDFTRKSNGTEYDYEITKKGTIREKSVEYKYKKNSSKAKIGRKAARKKAAKHSGVSYNTVKKGTCTYEYSNKKKEGKYEVKFKTKKYKYEYEILAPNGTVMEYDKKRR